MFYFLSLLIPKVIGWDYPDGESKCKDMSGNICPGEFGQPFAIQVDAVI